MTLNEWCVLHGNAIYLTPSFHVYCECANHPEWSAKMREPLEELYNLSDYKVSSRSGPVVWLVPLQLAKD